MRRVHSMVLRRAEELQKAGARQKSLGALAHYSQLRPVGLYVKSGGQRHLTKVFSVLALIGIVSVLTGYSSHSNTTLTQVDDYAYECGM